LKKCIDIGVDLAHFWEVSEFKLDRVVDVEKATKQKRYAAGEIFNALAFLS